MLISNKIKTNKLLFYTGVFFLLLILMIAICEALGWPFLKKPLHDFMEKRMERTVRIDGPFKLRLIGGIHLEAGGLWISAPQGFTEPNLVDAHDIELRLRYSDLWNIKPGDSYVIKSIKANKVEAHLTRQKDGKSTWQFKKDPNDPIRPFPIIQALAIKEGQAYVKDSLTTADVLIEFTTDEGQKNAHPISKVKIHGDFRDRKLKSELMTNGFLPIASQDKNSSPISSKGWLQYGKMYMTFNGSVFNLFGEQNIKGQLIIHGPSLGDLGDLLSITLPNTTDFKIVAGVAKNPDGWQIAVNSAHVGRSDLYGHFRYDTQPEKSMLTGELKGKRFFLADLAPAFGNETIDGKVRQRIFPDKPLDFATYNRMNAKISVDIDYVDLGNAFKEPLTPLKASLALNKNKLSLAKLYAKTADGSIAGDIFIDAHDQKQNIKNPQELKDPNKPKPDWGINLVVKDIDLKKWLTISDARKEKAKKEHKNETAEAYVTGSINGKANLKGKGISTAELLRTLNGDLSIFVKNGEISHLIVEAVGLDIAQAVGLLVKGDNNLKMQCAVLDFKASQGIFKPNVALIDTSVTTVVVDGKVNMGEESLDLKVAAEPKNFSPFTVRSPLKVTGTFLNPKVSAEPAPIAARVAGGLLLAFVNPLAAIIPFLDPGSATDKEKRADCAQTLGELQQSLKKNNALKKDMTATSNTKNSKKSSDRDGSKTSNEVSNQKPTNVNDSTKKITETIQPK
ncbi:MAG: AsmA family protein [Methylotenera sp.]|nr:AsmA family protein [Methylotenera sp.]